MTSGSGGLTLSTPQAGGSNCISWTAGQSLDSESKLDGLEVVALDEFVKTIFWSVAGKSMLQDGGNSESPRTCDNSISDLSVFFFGLEVITNSDLSFFLSTSLETSCEWISVD